MSACLTQGFGEHCQLSFSQNSCGFAADQCLPEEIHSSRSFCFFRRNWKTVRPYSMLWFWVSSPSGLVSSSSRFGCSVLFVPEKYAISGRCARLLLTGGLLGSWKRWFWGESLHAVVVSTVPFWLPGLSGRRIENHHLTSLHSCSEADGARLSLGSFAFQLQYQTPDFFILEASSYLVAILEARLISASLQPIQTPGLTLSSTLGSWCSVSCRSHSHTSLSEPKTPAAKFLQQSHSPDNENSSDAWPPSAK